MFSIGRAPKLSREEKKKQEARRRKQRRREQRRKERPEEGEIVSVPAGYTFSPRAWFLLPTSSVSPSLQRYTLSLGQTFTAAYGKLQEIAQRPRTLFKSKESMSFLATFEKKFGKLPTMFGPPSQKTLESIQLLLRYNQKIRCLFSRLVFRWKRSKLQRANDSDMVTMDAPQKEVVLYDWKHGRTYHFEAASLFKSFLRCLQNHDSIWSTPHELRNPYTNIPLTFAQAYHTMAQLRAHGFTHWTLEGLRAARYSFSEFQAVHAKPLRLAALRAAFQTPDSEDTIELIHDFIESEHEHNDDAPFLSATYRWAIRNCITARIQEWRRLCYLYYYYDITIDCATLRKKYMDKHIFPYTAALCDYPLEIIAAYRLACPNRVRVSLVSF